MALTLQQAKDELARCTQQIQERELRMNELNAYIAALQEEAAVANKKANALSKGTLDGVRF